MGEEALYGIIHYQDNGQIILFSCDLDTQTFTIHEHDRLSDIHGSLRAKANTGIRGMHQDSLLYTNTFDELYEIAIIIQIKDRKVEYMMKSPAEDVVYSNVVQFDMVHTSH